MAEEERFDGIFMNIVQQAAGIENFFDALFGFMRRKTDFFSNPDAGKGMISKHFDAQLEVFQAQKHREEQTRKQRAAKQEAEAKPEPPKPAPKPTPKVVEVTDEEAEEIASGTAPEESKEEPKATEGEPKSTEEGRGLEGNGGRTDKFIWTQTLGELTINVFIPSDVPARQIRVNCTQSTLAVTAAGTDVVNGRLSKRVKPDELVWNIDTVEGQRVVAITVDKLDGMNWWSCIFEGDTEIDTKKIVPENSKLSDLDGEMRTTVEKMMVDQARKAQGLPTTDEEQKQEMLKKFMKAHPEMDFSKAKFS